MSHLIHKVKAAGFILFSVLLFLQIFTLSGLYGVMLASSLSRRGYYQWHTQVTHYQAQQVMQQIEIYLQSHVPLCIISPISASLLASYKNEWWKEFSCHGNFAVTQYYYVVEILGKDPCSSIYKQEALQSLIAEYYRISLLFLPDANTFAKNLLQSVIVKANDEPLICAGERHFTALGRQMQRELIGRKI
jgi:hypothetical protein